MGKHLKKKKKIKVKNPKRPLILILLIIILLAIVVINNNSIKNKKENSIIVNNEDVTNKLENEIIINDNIVYLSINDIKKCLDPNIYQEDKKIITSSDKKIAVIELDSDNIEINGSTVQIKGQVFQTEQETIYLPISELQNVYDIELEYIEEYKNIVIDELSKRLEKAYVTKNLLIKEERKNFSSNIEKVNKGNWVVYVSEEKGWAKVRTQNGNLGYVKKKNLTNFVIQREELEQENKNWEDASYEKNITKSNIKKYEDRKKVIEQILQEAVKQNERIVKITYEKDAEAEEFSRFKIEATAILKECGITVVF